MTTELATRSPGAIIEAVIAQGDLAKLTPEQRVNYYREVCQSLNLNALTRPFEYLTLNGKMVLYARKDCTDQLRTIHGVSVTRLERERIDDLYAVTAYATDKNGRSDSAIGAVSVVGLKGEALANALMKAETKAKRRVTLSLCGLGWTDESELESIQSAATIVVDQTTGEIIEERPAEPMVTHPEDKLYQRYMTLVEEAQRLEVEYEAPQLPMPVAALRAAGVDLKARVDAAKKAAV